MSKTDQVGRWLGDTSTGEYLDLASRPNPSQSSVSTSSSKSFLPPREVPDISPLSFLYPITGKLDKRKKMIKIAKTRKDIPVDTSRILSTSEIPLLLPAWAGYQIAGLGGGGLACCVHSSGVWRKNAYRDFTCFCKGSS